MILTIYCLNKKTSGKRKKESQFILPESPLKKNPGWRAKVGCVFPLPYQPWRGVDQRWYRWEWGGSSEVGDGFHEFLLSSEKRVNQGDPKRLVCLGYRGWNITASIWGLYWSIWISWNVMRVFEREAPGNVWEVSVLREKWTQMFVIKKRRRKISKFRYVGQFLWENVFNIWI